MYIEVRDDRYNFTYIYVYIYTNTSIYKIGVLVVLVALIGHLSTLLVASSSNSYSSSQRSALLLVERAQS